MPRAAGFGSHRDHVRGPHAAGEANARRAAGDPLASDVVSPLNRVPDSKRDRRVVAPAVRLLAGAGLACSSILLVAFARPPVGPRSPAMIGSVLAQGAHAADCDACHTAHAADQPIAYEHALVGPDDNTLCDGCHTLPWSGGSYGGTLLYAGSAHGSSATAIWPGPQPPARPAADPTGWDGTACRDTTPPWPAPDAGRS